MTPDAPTGPPNEHGCVCLAPGFCPKLGRDTTKWGGILHRQCRTEPGYCDAMTQDGTREVHPREKKPGAAMPPMADRAKGFGKAVTATAVAAMNRQPVMATAEQAAERRAICNGCDNLVVGKLGTTWCGKEDGCGCLLPLKVWTLNTACPKDKWPKLT